MGNFGAINPLFSFPLIKLVVVSYGLADDIPIQSRLYSTVSGTVWCSLSYTPPPKNALRGSTCEHPVVGAINGLRYIMR